MSEIPDVLCINCEDMISYDKVEMHSSICTKPSSQVLKLISSNYHYQIQYKLNKLKSAIELIAYSSRFIENPEQNIMIKLINYANELISITTPGFIAIDKTTEISSALRKISESISSHFLIYSERLRCLALEKTYAFLEYLNSNKESEAIKSFILSKNQELHQVRNKINSYNKKSSYLQGILKNFEGLDDIKSQVESNPTVLSSINSDINDDKTAKENIEDLDCMFLNKKEEVNKQGVRVLGC